MNLSRARALSLSPPHNRQPLGHRREVVLALPAPLRGAISFCFCLALPPPTPASPCSTESCCNAVLPSARLRFQFRVRRRVSRRFAVSPPKHFKAPPPLRHSAPPPPAPFPHSPPWPPLSTLALPLLSLMSSTPFPAPPPVPPLPLSLFQLSRHFLLHNRRFHTTWAPSRTPCVSKRSYKQNHYYVIITRK